MWLKATVAAATPDRPLQTRLNSAQGVEDARAWGERGRFAEEYNPRPVREPRS